MKSLPSTLLVYLEIDWLNEPTLVGRLFHDDLRSSFEFDGKWLESHPTLRLSAGLENFPGRQHRQSSCGLFGCFSDTLPNRWGRMLIKRSEQIAADRDNRACRSLSDFEMLYEIDDASRMGAFRFKTHPEGEFLNVSFVAPIPPITAMRELATAVNEIEESEFAKELPQEKWLLPLIKPAASLGGARPKTNVIDEAGSLWIAKFPSRNDDYDIGAWEQFAYCLAHKAGIHTAPSKVMNAGGRHHAFLVKRFDRNADGRIHFSSSMTMIGLTDGDGAATGHGYLDIVDAILSNCVDVEANLEELYRRVAFNICIGNTDDHFRNHGFLLTKAGWTLSPAYDLNPTTRREQSLLIDSTTDTSDLEVLRAAAGSYFLEQKTADRVIKEVLRAMDGWPQVAAMLKLSKREVELFADRFITTNSVSSSFSA